MTFLSRRGEGRVAIERRVTEYRAEFALGHVERPVGACLETRCLPNAVRGGLRGSVTPSLFPTTGVDFYSSGFRAHGALQELIICRECWGLTSELGN